MAYYLCDSIAIYRVIARREGIMPRARELNDTEARDTVRHATHALVSATCRLP